MASKPEEDDLKPEMTEGYKPGGKKSVDEYAKLDAEDEALNRWKASIGIGPMSASESIADPNDPRKVKIYELALEVEGRPDVVIKLDEPGVLENLSKKPFIVQEGAEYRMRVKFQVQHEVISGLRYLQSVKRKGIQLQKRDEMMGSYGPNTKSNPMHEKRFAPEEAPSGMLVRAKYDVFSRFMDDDHNKYLEFHWALEIKKNWD